MALKDWLTKFTSAAGKAGSKKSSRRTGAAVEKALSIDDLITLERYEEALVRLKKRVSQNKGDYRARTQLADVYLKTGKSGEAIEEYLSVADRYTSEGFFDKGYALVAKIARMLPNEEKLQSKMATIRRAKRLEHRRQLVVGCLGTAQSAIEVRQYWHELIRGPIVEVLSDEQLARLFPLLELRKLDEGQVLVERDSSRQELYVILGGEISAEVELASGKATDLRTFRGGDIVGELALLKRLVWPATYRAKKTTKLLALTRAGLEKALVGEEDPRGFLNSLRLQAMDEQVAEAVGKLKTPAPS